MSDYGSYFYCHSDDYYSDDDQSYLYTPATKSLSQANKQSQIPPWRREPGESSEIAVDQVESQPDEKEKEVPAPTLAKHEPIEASSKKESQYEVGTGSKRARIRADSEGLPVQKKAKSI